MIVIRFALVALLVVLVALGLAWILTGNRTYLLYVRRVFRFALIGGMLVALLYVVERVVLR